LISYVEVRETYKLTATKSTAFQVLHHRAPINEQGLIDQTKEIKVSNMHGYALHVQCTSAVLSRVRPTLHDSRATPNLHTQDTLYDSPKMMVFVSIDLYSEPSLEPFLARGSFFDRAITAPRSRAPLKIVSVIVMRLILLAKMVR
jgi:hypothetical protein